MFPFWGPVIAPVLEAAEVRSVVEIGALRGDNTRQIMERLGPDGVLHVIDPVPGFDPSEHEREFPGRYVFHQALSLDVLGTLPTMDAALIDGDHNWYTVYNELRLIREVARRAAAPLPVLVLHDVAWPYGRRDLYYAPETIPADFRHPHRRAGMRPGRTDLLPEGQGMSQGLWNAEVEGGPRNGVMTALDDWVAEHDRPLRIVHLPLYFGLAVVVEQERLDRQPALATRLDRIEGAGGMRSLVEMGERVRLRAVVNHHTVVRQHADRIERLATRYVDQVVRGLAADAGDPGRTSLTEVRAALDRVASDQVPGSIVLHGRETADLAVLAGAHAAAHGPDSRSVWVVGPGGTQELAAVRTALDAFDLLDERVHLVADADPASPTGPLGGSGPVAVLLVGHGATAAEVGAVLRAGLPAVAGHGWVVVADASVPGVGDAISQARAEAGHTADTVPFGSSGLRWVVAATAPAAGPPAP